MRGFGFYNSRGEFDDLSALYVGIILGFLIAAAMITVAVFV